MATFKRTFYRYFDAKEIANAIEGYYDYTDEEQDGYEHNTEFVPIMDFAYDSEDDCEDFDFELTTKEEDVIIKEVTEELRKRGWK